MTWNEFHAILEEFIIKMKMPGLIEDDIVYKEEILSDSGSS